LQISLSDCHFVNQMLRSIRFNVSDRPGHRELVISWLRFCLSVPRSQDSPGRGKNHSGRHLPGWIISMSCNYLKFFRIPGPRSCGWLFPMVGPIGRCIFHAKLQRYRDRGTQVLLEWRLRDWAGFYESDSQRRLRVYDIDLNYNRFVCTVFRLEYA